MGPRLVLVVAGLVVLGCHHHRVRYQFDPFRDYGTWVGPDSSCSATSPRWLPLTRASDTLTESATRLRSDARDAWIARRVPGGWAGGPYRETAGGAILFLRDTTEKDAALAALDTLAPRHGLPAIAFDSVRMRQVRWDLAELYDWRVALEENFDVARGVRFTGWGIEPLQNRVGLMVADSASLAALPRWLQQIHAPCRLVGVTGVGMARLLASPASAAPRR